jgi:hypothetical protein
MADTTISDLARAITTNTGAILPITIAGITYGIPVSAIITASGSMGTGHFQLPVGTTDQRGAPEKGAIRFNSTINSIEWYDGSMWSGNPKTVEFVLWGAGGGSGSQNRIDGSYRTTTQYFVKEGGAGGYVSATYSINPGTVLIFSVGGGGKGGLIQGNPSSASGGYNGGGNGTYTQRDASGGGGGYSGIFMGQKNQNGALLIAPGGGGGSGGPGYPGSGADKANGGGGIVSSLGIGNAGTTGYGGGGVAGGGTNLQGGVGGTGGYSQPGTAGSALLGANGVFYNNTWGSGGGGGGGWFGGGSGANDGTAWSGGGGGAGSAFVRGATINYPAAGATPFAGSAYINHSFGIQEYGKWGDGSVQGGYQSMRLPTNATSLLYTNNAGLGGPFNISASLPAGYDGSNGLIAYRVNGGLWTTVNYSGTDVFITIT